MFEGKIVASDGAYFVEKAHHYFPPKEQKSQNQTVHSVIYNEEHVDDPHHNHGENSTGCGINEEVIEWMQQVQNSAVDEDEDGGRKGDKYGGRQHSTSFLRNGFETPYDKYSRQANFYDDYGEGGHRQKRAAPKENKRNTCSLFIQTDPLIWRHIREGFLDVSTRKNCLKGRFKCKVFFFRIFSIEIRVNVWK